MRVTQNTNFDVARNSVHRTKSRMEGLQLQHATLKKLNTPSDDPVGASKVLEVRTDKVNNDQFMMNAKLAETFLENTDTALGDLSDIMVRAKEIAIGQASGASSTESTRLGVAEEIKQLYLQAIGIANRRIGDRYLFGGYKTDRPPVDDQGRYQGDKGQMMVEIGRDTFISMNIPGYEAFNTAPKASPDFRTGSPDEPQATEGSRAPAQQETVNSHGVPEELQQNVNAFDELQSLRIGLLTGDLESIRNTLERFDQAHSRLVSVRAKVGSRINGIQNTYQALERHNVTQAQLTSTLEDADMAQVVSDLAKEETVLRSALASSQKLIQPTLLDFLK